jgi:hypothetical protein
MLGSVKLSVGTIPMKPIFAWDRRLPCTEDCCQRKEAAIGHLWGTSITSVNHPIEQWANIGITFKQKNDRLSSQLVDLQQNIKTVWMKTR